MTELSHTKIVDHPDLIREMSSKAVLSTNRKELSRYQQQRQQRLKEQKYQQSLEERVSILESQIKELLERLK